MASSFLSNCDFTLLKSHFTGLFTDDNLLYDYQVSTFDIKLVCLIYMRKA